MNSTVINYWRDANQRYLLAALAVVRGVLKRYSSQDLPEFKDLESPQQALQEAADAMPAPPALERLCRMFDSTLR